MFKVTYIETVGNVYTDDYEYREKIIREFLKSNLLKKKVKLKSLGSGAYSSVYPGNSKNRVFKVGSCDRAYLRYLFELRKQKKVNPYFPKIFNLWIFGPKGRVKPPFADCSFIVELERCSFSEKLSKIDESFSVYYSGMDNEDELDLIGDMKRLKLTVNKKQLKDSVLFLRKIENKYRLCSDLWNGNYLVRDRKQLVFTDPFC